MSHTPSSSDIAEKLAFIRHSDNWDEGIEHLSAISAAEALECAAPYLKLVAQQVDYIFQDETGGLEGNQAIDSKRYMLLQQTLSAQNMREMPDMPPIEETLAGCLEAVVTNVHKVWLQLSKNEPKQFFELARKHPELLVMEVYELPHLFKANELDYRRKQYFQHAVDIARQEQELLHPTRGDYTAPTALDGKTFH